MTIATRPSAADSGNAVHRQTRYTREALVYRICEIDASLCDKDHLCSIINVYSVLLMYIQGYNNNASMLLGSNYGK